MQLKQLLKVVVLLFGLGIGSLQSQTPTQLKEYIASEEIDAEHLAAVADSFKIPHVVFYAIAWQETRRGDFNYRFPRGPGKEIVDSIIARSNLEHGWAHTYSHKVCREVGRFQMRPCMNWAKLLHDPICTTANLMSSDRYFAYRVDVHCAAEHLASLHGGNDWIETIRHYNGDGIASFKYLEEVLSYIGRFYLRLTE